MQTVRDALETSDSWGLDGSSNLFYYLFDDWRAVYYTVAVFQKKLRGLVCHLPSSKGRPCANPPLAKGNTLNYSNQYPK